MRSILPKATQKDMKFTYQIEICKSDGTTPIGECSIVEIEATDRHQAFSEVMKSNPGYDFVSWGRKDEIEEFDRSME